jgi:anti-sigma factor RsiW
MPEHDDEPRPNELIAYLDGELDERAHDEMERRLSADPALRREADEMRRAWELLDFLPQAEPSATFASRTLERLSVVRPSATSTRRPAPPSPSITQVDSRRRPWLRRLAIGTGALAIFGIGYVLPGPFFKKTLPVLSQSEMEDQMARDLRVIDHLTMYQHGNDLNFVVGLDQSELFGESP